MSVAIARRKPPDRVNQQYRTRKDLLAAAAPLMKEGRNPEAMILLKDALRIDEASARDAKEWAVRALVKAALDEEAGVGSRTREGTR